MRTILGLVALLVVSNVLSCKTVNQKPMLDDAEVTESDEPEERDTVVAPTDERPSESEIDLGLTGSGATRINVDVTNDDSDEPSEPSEPDEPDDETGDGWSCGEAEDCYGREPEKKTGKWRCVESQCVFDPKAK